jgi:hypothetical protein
MRGPDAQPSLPTAALRELGVTRGELAGPRWRTPFRGIHTPAVAPGAAPLQRIHDAAPLVPAGAAIGGWAAGYLLGAHDLDGRGLDGRQREAVVILVPRSCHLRDRDGVRFVRTSLADDDRRDIDGIPVTGLVKTTFDLARSRDLEGAVVAADAMARQVGVDPLSVREYARRHPRMRGVPVARRALDFADPRSRSVGESRLRVLWVVDVGLPIPQCNAYVVDVEGIVVAMPDLLDVESGLAGEYDGGTHRELAGHTSDNVREEGLEDLGLVVVRATSLDVGAYRTRTVRRLLDGHRRACAVTSRAWGWRPGPGPALR